MATAPNNWIAQFRGLSMDNVGSWPMLPKLGLWVAVVIVCAIVGWFVVWNDQLNQLDQLKQQESTLKDQYKLKIQQAINLEELRRQKEQVNQSVVTLEKQLPSTAENNLNVQTIKSSQLSLDAVAKTFRYLDEDEVSAQRKARAPKAGGK